MMKSFPSTLVGLPGSFSCYLEQLFFAEPVRFCFRRKELHSRCYFRSFKNTQGWKLQLAGTPYSVSFKAPLKIWLEVRFVSLETVYCKPATPIKRGLFEISRRVTFRDISFTCYIYRQSCKTEVSFTLLKSDSTTYVLPQTF